MKSYIVRAITKNNDIRAFAAITTGLVEEARLIHNTTPVATCALGRLLTAVGMMGVMLKGEKDTVTAQIKGNGPLGSVIAISDSHANVRGYVNNPETDIPLREDGKLDVRGAIGQGYLNVIKDLGLKDPYIGQVPLISGEIGEDLAYYYATSEQINSVIGVGVLIERDYSVDVAGGFIIQALPSMKEEEIVALEEKVNTIKSVTNLFKEHKTPEEVIKYILNDFDIEITDIIETKYLCNCSRERIERALISIGKKDLKEIIDEEGQAELSCHFCNNKYNFNKEELTKLYTEANK